MAYSTIDDLTRWIDEGELVRLCSRDPGATIASAEVTAVVAEAIQSADARIDSHLLGRWPGLRGYDPVPDEVNRISAMLAVYYLYLRRRAVSSQWRENQEECMALLREARRGETSLGLDDTGRRASEPEGSFRTDAEDGDRRYTDDKLDRL